MPGFFISPLIVTSSGDKSPSIVLTTTKSFSLKIGFLFNDKALNSLSKFALMEIKGASSLLISLALKMSIETKLAVDFKPSAIKIKSATVIPL